QCSQAVSLAIRACRAALAVDVAAPLKAPRFRIRSTRWYRFQSPLNTALRGGFFLLSTFPAFSLRLFICAQTTCRGQCYVTHCHREQRERGAQKLSNTLIHNNSAFPEACRNVPKRVRNVSRRYKIHSKRSETALKRAEMASKRAENVPL